MTPLQSLLQSGYLKIAATLVLLFSGAQCVRAADIPEGFAKDVTGGGSAAAVHPSTLDELRSALCASHDSHGACTDDTPRVIVRTTRSTSARA